MRDWYPTYCDWLINVVNFEGINFPYVRLLHALYDTPYVATNESDENRRHDALCLRQRFAHESNDFIPEEYCTLLEMLVQYARIIDQRFIANPGVPKHRIIFWMMIDSLGLRNMTDDVFNEELYNQAIAKFFAGEKSLFMTSDPGVNREISIAPNLWYKMEVWNRAMCERIFYTNEKWFVITYLKGGIVL